MRAINQSDKKNCIYKDLLDGYLRMSCGTVQLWCTIAAHNCPIDAVRQRWEVPGAKHASGLRTAREPTSLPPSVTPLGYLSPTSADGYSVWRRVLSPARPGRQRVGGVPGYLRHNSSRYHTATELHPKSYDWRTLLLPIGVLLLLPTDVLWMIRCSLVSMGKRFVLQSGF